MDQRPYPQAVAAERALLGQILSEPDVLREAQTIVSAADFYDTRHAELFQLLTDMRDRHEPIDLVTLPEQLMQSREADRYGGIAYVVQLPEHAPSVANVSHYAEVVADRAGRRKLIEAARAMIESAHSAESVADALGQCAEVVAGVRPPGRHEAVTVGQALDEAMDEADRLANGETSPVVPTCYHELDRWLGGGLHGDELVILAARPSMAKSALALNIALNVSNPEREDPRTVGVFSLEMTRTQLSHRMISTWKSHPLSMIVRSDQWSQETWDAVLSTKEALEHCPQLWDCRPGLSVDQIRAEAVRWKMRHPDLAMIIVDYLGLIKNNARNKSDGLGKICKGLKDLAKELGIPVLLLCQLNRKLEERQDKMPIMSDLRDSGEIEQDADTILFLHRPVYFDHRAPPRLAQVKIGKQRQGERDVVVDLEWFGEVQRFVNPKRKTGGGGPGPGRSQEPSDPVEDLPFGG